MRSRFILATLVVTLACPAAVTAAPLLIGGTLYDQTGGTEVVTATFLQSDGGQTSGTYSGLVLLTVEGSGAALFHHLNDAFYVYTGYAWVPFADPYDHYQLAFDSQALGSKATTRIAKNFIVYDVDAGLEVTQPYTPAYRADHIYTFVVDTGLVVPSLLHFGVVDDNFTDNDGAYRISVTQLQPVPEPATLLLLGTGLAVAGRRFHCRRASTMR